MTLPAMLTGWWSATDKKQSKKDEKRPDATVTHGKIVAGIWTRESPRKRGSGFRFRIDHPTVYRDRTTRKEYTEWHRYLDPDDILSLPGLWLKLVRLTTRREDVSEELRRELLLQLPKTIKAISRVGKVLLKDEKLPRRLKRQLALEFNSLTETDNESRVRGRRIDSRDDHPRGRDRSEER